MTFPVLLFSISLLFNTVVFAEERHQKMGIVLVAVGEIDRNVMDWLKNDLTKVFNGQVVTAKECPNRITPTIIKKTVFPHSDHNTYQCPP